jgi:GTPase SAR1 family protein
MPEQSNDYRVVVFGAGGVGKSSLVLRFVKGTFRESYIPTVEDTYRQVKKDNYKSKLFRNIFRLYQFKFAAFFSH